jgi:ABC-2 type transport system permease protein
MMNFLRSAFVIGRRDFIATVYTRTFIIFLVSPLLMIGLSIVFGNVIGRSAQENSRPVVAVVADQADFAPIKAAYDRIDPAFGKGRLPKLTRVEPDYDPDLQIQTLLASRGEKIVAVLTGGLAMPTLTGSLDEDDLTRRRMEAVLDLARQQQALKAAGTNMAPVTIKLIKVDESAGSLARERASTAMAGQMLVFMLTLILAGMLLSNLVEEKSNKVIEVLAAAVPVDAIFVGKLFSMLAVSLVGIAIWAAGGVTAAMIWSSGTGLPEPAVGWPMFVILVMIYYAANYLLLGALFLGLGSQAASIREVQTLSMPITVGQMLLLMVAMFVSGQLNGILGIGAAIFPFSSPLMMVSRAAQMEELWPHLVAILWQGFWVWLTVSLAASLFRRNVMKSGSGTGPRRRGLRRRAETRA